MVLNNGGSGVQIPALAFPGLRGKLLSLLASAFSLVKWESSGTYLTGLL